MTLSFDYDASENCEIAEYRGLTIKAVRDEMADCPWTAWDGNAPCLLLNRDWRRDELTAYDKDAGIDLERPFTSGAISDAILRRHMKAFCAIFDGFDVYQSFIGTRLASAAEYIAQEARDNQARYGGSLTEYKREALQQCLDDMRATDRLAALESVYSIIGWPALCTSSSGYCQGDYVELLFVATPHFIETMGAPKITDKDYWRRDLESARDLMGAWLWGDVYGFEIESDGETIDSCYGYYGDDHDKSGLASAAKHCADYILKAASKRRNARLGELIRNRVPLEARGAELAKAGVLQ